MLKRGRTCLANFWILTQQWRHIWPMRLEKIGPQALPGWYILRLLRPAAALTVTGHVLEPVEEGRQSRRQDHQHVDCTRSIDDGGNSSSSNDNNNNNIKHSISAVIDTDNTRRPVRRERANESDRRKPLVDPQSRVPKAKIVEVGWRRLARARRRRPTVPPIANGSST